jgi:hypothetical protein
MNETIKFSIKAIKERAKNRPEGYYEDVISGGKIVGDYVEIDHFKAVELVEKYKNYQSMPSTLQMIKNFGKAVSDEVVAISNGKKSINEELSKKRIEICNSCEFIDKKSKRCTKCGCFLKWKTVWRSQKCPIGKW